MTRFYGKSEVTFDTRKHTSAGRGEAMSSRWRFTLALLVLLGTIIPVSRAQNAPSSEARYVVRTIAGSLLPGYGGDGGPADMASLNWARGIDVDSMGNIYLADSENCRIRKIDTEGMITTVVGNGTCGIGEEEVPALLSPLDKPWDVAVNDMGEIYFTEGRRIRKVDAEGLLFTVGGAFEGMGEGCSDQDLVPALFACLQPKYLDLAPDGTIYFSDGFVPDRVRKIDLMGDVSTVAGRRGVGFLGDGLLATDALLNNPLGVVYHDGSLYIADYGNFRVRCVDPMGIINTVAGTGELGGLPDGIAGLEANVSPQDLWFDEIRDRLLIANLSTAAILELDSLGLVNVVIGPADSEILPDILSENTPDRETRLRTPRGIAIDPVTEDLIYSEGNPPAFSLPGSGEDPTLTAAARIRRGFLGAEACQILPPGNFMGTVGLSFLEEISYLSPMIESATATGLPPGLMVSPDQEIKIIRIIGTPLQPGTFDVTLVLGCGARAEFQIVIAPSACSFLTDSPLPSGQVGLVYSAPILYSALAVQTVSLVSGQLPPGLTLVPPVPEMEGSSWRIAGTPTQSGAFAFLLRLEPCGGQMEYELTIDPSGLVITTELLPPATVGCEYSAVLAASGGLPPYLFSLASGMLPGGITFESSGRIFGIPTESGNRGLGIRVTDSLEASSVTNFDLLVSDALTWLTAALPEGTVGQTYPETQLEVSGGVLPRVFSLVTPLPAGLLLSSDGRISGTPAESFSGEVQFQVSSTPGCSSSVILPLVIRAPGPTELELSSSTTTAEFRSEYEAVIRTNTPASNPLTGTINLSFLSSVEEGQDNPEVTLATDPRSRSAAFTIPEGESEAQFPGGNAIRFNSGTVAGTITLQATIEDNGALLSDSLQYVIPPTPPQILSMTLARSGNQLTITATGYAPRRRITNGTLVVVPRSGVDLSGSATIPLSQLNGVFQTYFQSANSRNSGSQFVLTIPLTVSGGAATDIAEVRLTLVGDSGENSNTQSAQ